jgi:hypothetical protein
LEANSALWASLKDAACGLLDGSDGADIELPIGKTVQGVTLLCENLDGTLAEFFTLREQIFDFQFDLVDSLTRVIRGDVE